jgi:hypothetical protein
MNSPESKETVKLLVIADEKGKIKAAARLPAPRTGDAPTEAQIVGLPGEKVHEVTLPKELLATQLPLLDDYHLKIEGANATLVKR